MNISNIKKVLFNTISILLIGMFLGVIFGINVEKWKAQEQVNCGEKIQTTHPPFRLINQ